MTTLWKPYLVAGVLLSATDLVLPAGLGRDLLYCLIVASGAAGVVVGARRNRPNQTLGWYLPAAGMASQAAGGAVYAWLRHTGSVVPFPVVVDVLDLMTYPLAAAGLLLFARGRSSEGRRAALLDSAIITVGVGLLSWVCVIEPHLAAQSGEPVVGRLAVIGYPLGYVLLFGTMVRLSKAPGVGRGACEVAVGVFGTMLALQSITQVAGLGAAADVRPSLFPPLWLLTNVLTGAIALHPSMRAFSMPSDTAPEPTRTREIAVLAGALLIGPAILGGELWAGIPLHAAPVVVASTVLVLMVLARMVGLVHHEQRQAATDELTGLPNRRALYLAGAARLTAPARRRQALLMLDLDRFKEVNDSLGHHAGDKLLVQVGNRLGERLRAGDLLVRLGGDEFAVLLEDAGQGEATTVAAALHAAFADPFPLDDMAVHSAGSIGIALFPDHGTDLSTLLRKADIALYLSKASGRPHLYGESDDDGGVGWLGLVEELRVALTSQQLVVHYQPKIDLRTGQTRGVEALVRWQHPTRGLVYPDFFLDLVEETRLMPALTRIVLQMALDQAVIWHADGWPLTVAVNLSASSLADVDLPDEVAAMLAARGLPPSALQLEITEEFLMRDRDRARRILTRLREHGIQIALDDFGTGYSSLGYLRDLPIDELKLDRSFVLTMADDRRAAALVASTIALAHSLELRMVAEGVENAAALTELARMGCDEAQGYYLSRPVPAEELDRWVRGRSTMGDPTESPQLRPSAPVR